MNEILFKLAELKYAENSNKVNSFSFEFFPPKTKELEINLQKSVLELAKLKPNFMTVTYGAGGSTHDKTLETVTFIQNKVGIKAAAHITAVNSKKEEVNKVIEQYHLNNITKVVALRGDMPGMVGKYQPTIGGYAYAKDLVSYIASLNKFEISVAGYPETHPEAKSADEDLSFLKDKVEAGANDIITQYCFDTDKILHYIDKVRAKNINVPIIPGIMLINNFKQLKKFSDSCGASIPEWLNNLCLNIDDNHETRFAVSVLVAYEQCKILLDAGITDFHFYSLNHYQVAMAVCHLLGI